MEFNRFLEYYSNAPEIEIPSTNDRRSERGPKNARIMAVLVKRQSVKQKKDTPVYS